MVLNPFLEGEQVKPYLSGCACQQELCVSVVFEKKSQPGGFVKTCYRKY